MNRQIGVKNFIRVVILHPRTKGNVIQRMRNPKIAMVRYVQPKGCLTILQVSLNSETTSTRNFRTIFGDALGELCVQLTRDLFVIAKFLLLKDVA